MSIDKDWSVVRLNKLIDPTDLIESPPWERGTFYYISPGNVRIDPEEAQVNDSFSRYNYPKFKDAHFKIKNVLEEVMGERLYPTYYFDRFYFKGNELKKHRDRDACEISVSLNISSNLDYDWPIYFQAKMNEPAVSVVCNPGDGVLYRGIDVWHWREPMRGNHKSYFHQVFFHYVRADGNYCHAAYDHC